MDASSAGLRDMMKFSSVPVYIVLLGLMLSSTTAHAVTYANAATTFNWIDASSHTKVGYNTVPYKFNFVTGCGTTPPILDDTLSDNIPLGFNFMYGGLIFSSVRIMSNGRLQFNNNTTCGFGSPVTQLPYPDATLNYTMRIYGNDLDPTSSIEVPGYPTSCVSRTTCYISYATLGTAPYRSFVVTWSHIPEWAAGGSTSGDYNLQVILQENGEFIYQYGVNTPGPQAATAQVGWQVDSNDYDVPAVGLPANNSAIKFFIPRPVAEYRMEQPNWNGTAGEVLDTSGNARHGTAFMAGASTRPTEVATGKVCRGGQIIDNNSAADISAIDTGIAVPTTVGGVGTITFWYNNSSNSPNRNRMLFDASTTNNRWFYLTRTSNGALSFVITDSGNAARTATTANNALPNTGWSHIAVSWNFNNLAAGNSDHLRIYVNGVLSQTFAFTTSGTISSSIGTLYVGDNRSSVSPVAASAGNPGSSNATLDEFRIYNFEGGLALVQRDMNQTGACLNHYAITTYGTPSTCQLVQVTVTAHDVAHSPVTMPNNTTQIALSTSTGRGNWSLVSGYGAFNNGAADDGIATYLFNGEYQVVLNYQATIAGNVNFNATDGQIVESGTEDPNLSVGGCVSSFNGCEAVCTPTSPPALGYAALYTKLSGTAFGQQGVALKSDGTLESGFSGSVAVDLLANINNGAALGANNCPVSQDAIIPLGSKIFSAGRTTISGVNIANAYRDVRMRFTCAPGVCGSSITACSSDNFAVRPQSFTVTANLGGTTLAAGNDFTMMAAAAVPAGYTGTPVLNTALVQDHNAAAAGVLNGSFNAATGSNATGTFQYHDVGTISTLADAVTDSAYTTIDQSNNDCVAGSTSNIPVGGKFGCNIGSIAAGPFGRFYPDHFTYVATLTPACASGAFSYMDQPALGVNLTLTAQSANGTTTARYTAGYAPLGTFSITGDNGGTAVDAARLSPALPAFAWNNGVYTATGNRAFTRNATPDGPYDSFALKATVSDPDGAGITGLALSNTSGIRFGRLNLSNAYGSELLNLPILLEAQYWNGSAYVRNASDSCTTIPPGSLIYSGFQSNLAACETHTVLSGALNAGRANPSLSLTAPGNGNSGSVNLAVNVGSIASGSTCASASSTPATAANVPWFGTNPSAKATFGIRKTPLIYLRENF